MKHSTKDMITTVMMLVGIEVAMITGAVLYAHFDYGWGALFLCIGAAAYPETLLFYAIYRGAQRLIKKIKNSKFARAEKEWAKKRGYYRHPRCS